MTVLTEIPLEFESYLRDKTLQKLPTNLNEFIFAYIPNLDLSVDIDRNSTIPNENLIVHRAPVASVGKTGENAIVYSAIIDSTVPEFTFNAIYLHDKNESNACGMIIHQQDETKQQAMTITKSALMQYDSAAASANVTVDAETWQVDISDLFAACSKVGHTHTLAEVGGSNPNLFINGCFSECIRYSRNTAIHAPKFGGYIVDRWSTRDPAQVGGTVMYVLEDVEGGVDHVLAGSRFDVHLGSPTSHWYMYQRIELKTFELSDILDNDFTITLKCASTNRCEINVTIYFCDNFSNPISGSSATSDTVIVDAIDEYSFNVRTVKSLQKNINMQNLTMHVEIRASVVENKSSVISFYNAKCEFGTVSTKFFPDHTSINQQKCGRYTRELFSVHGSISSINKNNISKFAVTPLHCLDGMRPCNAAVVGDIKSIVRFVNETYDDVRTVSCNIPSDGIPRIMLQTEGDNTSYPMQWLWLGTGKLLIDAEI